MDLPQGNDFLGWGHFFQSHPEKLHSLIAIDQCVSKGDTLKI